MGQTTDTLDRRNREDDDHQGRGMLGCATHTHPMVDIVMTEKYHDAMYLS